MENRFLFRLNTLHIELIEASRIRFDGLNYHIKSRQTGEWKVPKILSGNAISAPTSLGTSLALKHLDFMRANSGPYTLEVLVQKAYEGEIHIYYKFAEGFWTKETRKMYFNLLKKNGEPIYERHVKEHHNPFYRNVSSNYTGNQKYRQFLIEMGEDPDKVSGINKLDTFLKEGRQIELEIIKLLSKYNAPFKYGVRFEGKLIPDIYNEKNNEAIDIKRYISTRIDKEIEKYTKYFSKVKVIYLIGSRSTEKVLNGVSKISIFKWIEKQQFYSGLSNTKKDEFLKELEQLAEKVNNKQVVLDRIDYHRKLVNKIIELDNLGYSNPQIGKELNINYKWVSSILNGSSLREYSRSYPEIYRKRQNEKRDYNRNAIPEIIKDLRKRGLSVKNIALEVNKSTDMVKYYLSELGINDKKIIENRNKRLDELFALKTEHTTLVEKFKWVVNELKGEYPTIKTGAVKFYYYKSYRPITKENIMNKCNA